MSNILKKIMTILIVCVCLGAFGACGKETLNYETSPKINMDVTSTPRPTSTPKVTATPTPIPVTDISNFEYRYNIAYDENGKVITDGSAGYVITGLKNTSLTEIYIPDCVVEIGEECFWGTECDYITKIVIPDSVRVIGEGAFGHCDNLKEVVMPAELEVLGTRAFKWCGKLESIIVPKGVREIGYETFYDCTSLKSVNLPESMEKIGGSAFENCCSLENVTVPEGVIYLEGSTFRDCTNLITVNLPDSLERIDSYAFCNCTSLTGIEIPSGVKEIGEGAFGNCISLTSIEIPFGVEWLEKFAFGGCDNLLVARIPTGVKIHNMAFNDGFGDIENCIIITEEGAYAVEWAELNHFQYGVEERWYDTSNQIQEPQTWNAEIWTNYTEDDFETEVLQFAEDEEWYVHFSFEGNTQTEVEADFLVASYSCIYYAERLVVADGDAYYLQINKYEIPAGESLDISIIINDMEVAKKTVNIKGKK